MGNKKETTIADALFNDIIVLRSVYNKSGIKYYILPCKDKLSNQLPACIKRVKDFNDPNSEMIMSDREKNDFSEGKLALFPENHIFEIMDGKTYDLRDMWQKAEWEAIKNCPLIAKDRDERDSKGNLVIDGPTVVNKIVDGNSRPILSGMAELYVDHPGLDTQRRVSKKQLIHKAESYIYDDVRGADGQRNMARILGKNMSNQPIADVIDFLIRVAEKDPNKIINLYTGGDIALRILFIEAKEKHIIYLKNKLYLYGDNIILGATDDAVLAWMKDPKNMKVLELIKKDTYPEYSSES